MSSVLKAALATQAHRVQWAERMGVMYGANEYKASTTLVKAALDFLRTLGIGGVTVAAFIGALPEPPQDWESFKATWPLFLVAVATAVFRAYNNWRKNANGGAILPMMLIGVLAAGLVAGGCAGMRPVMETTTLPDGTVIETVNVDATLALQNASLAQAETALNMFITAMEAVRELKGDEWSAEDQARYEREQARQERNIELMREALELLMSRRGGVATLQSE